MRLSTTIGAPPCTLPLFAHRPHHDHGDDDGDELQQHPKPHQVLRAAGRSAAHHVDEAEQQHDGHGRNHDRQNDRTQKGCHRRYITPASTDFHTLTTPCIPPARNQSTIWPLIQYYQILAELWAGSPYSDRGEM